MTAVSEPEVAGSAPEPVPCGETGAGQREDVAATAAGRTFANCDADGVAGERDLDLGRDRKPFGARDEDQNVALGVDPDVDRNGGHGEGEGCNGGISEFERKEELANCRDLCLENGHGSESGADSEGTEQELEQGLGSVVVMEKAENVSQPEDDQKASNVVITVEEEESYENGGLESEGKADEALELEGNADVVLESEGKGDEAAEGVQCGCDSESAIMVGMEKEPGNGHQVAEDQVKLGSITEERSMETPIADADPEDARDHSDLAGQEGGAPTESGAEVEINLHVNDQSGSDVEVLLSSAKTCIDEAGESKSSDAAQLVEVAEGEVGEDGEFEKACVGDKPDPAVEMGASLSESVIAGEVESNNAAPVVGGLEVAEQEHEVEEKQVQYVSVSAQVVQEDEPKVCEFVVKEATGDLPYNPDSDTGVQAEETEIVPMGSSASETVSVEIEMTEETVEATETVDVVALSTFESTHFESEVIESENLRAIDANIEQTNSDLQREESPTIVLMEASTSNLIHAVTEDPEALYASEDLHAVEGNIVEEDPTYKQEEDPNSAIDEASSSESITIDVVEDSKNENEIGENIVKDRDFVVDASLAKSKHELEASNEIREYKDEDAVSEESPIGKLEEKAPLSDSGAAEGTKGPSDDISPSSEERNDASVQRRRMAWIIRYPRYLDDEKEREIQRARCQLDEKTQIRNSINADIHKLRTSVGECRMNLEDEKAKEREAKDRLRTKRQERDSVHAMLDRIRSATSADDIGEQIQRLEHMMQHETMPLKQEKQCMAEIKRLKQQRDELRYHMDPNMDAQAAFDKRTEMEQRLKDLRKELDVLSAGVSLAEHNRIIAMDKYDKENKIFNETKDKRTNANDSRQKVYEALTKLNDLKKHHWTYKKDRQTALGLEAACDKEELLLHCQNQVEKFMEMWNNNDEFRHQYLKSNMPSTVRRFMTLDGRSLGLDEEPIVLSRTVEKASSNMASSSSESDAAAPVFPALDAKDGNLDPVAVPEGKKNVAAPSDVAQRDLPLNVKKVTTRAAPPSEASTKSVPIEEVVVAKKLTKEEEDIIRKAEEQARIEEESRKEKLAAELKELHRLEQKAKAKEAEERKRKQAEKAQAKAEYKAQKEAEFKEKEKAKKEMKKKKKAASTDTPLVANAKADGPSVESTQLPQPSQEPDAAAPRKKQSRPPPPAPTKKYNKEVRPLPPPLRNRNKRRMSAWVWAAVALAVVVSALFLPGSSLGRFLSAYFPF